MTEEEMAKAISKFLIGHKGQNLTQIEKELLKQAIDQSHNWQELIAVVMLARMK